MSFLDKAMAHAAKGNIRAMVAEAEDFELSCGGVGIGADLSPHLFTTVILGHLALGDLPNARYTYTRAQSDAAASKSPLVQASWSLATLLWKHDVVGALKAIPSVKLPCEYKPLLSEVETAVRRRQLTAITAAYKDISVSDVTALLGLGNDSATMEYCKKMAGWVPTPESKGTRFGICPSDDVQNAPGRGYCAENATHLASGALFLEVN
eukprot:PhM_4_TR809/c0_g1_i1/m.90718/K12181/COPS8, CSN8; COP9 signalosome complex subunit 8